MPKQIRTKIVVVIYVSSVITLVGYLLLYFQYERQVTLTDDLLEKYHPIAISWVQLQGTVHKSIAAQRGWVLLEVSQLEKEWVNSRKEIVAIIQKLISLYRDPTFQQKLIQQGRAIEERKLYEIRLKLQKWEQLQMEIENLLNEVNAKNQKLYEQAQWAMIQKMITNQSMELLKEVEQEIQTIVQWQVEFSSTRKKQIQSEFIVWRNWFLSLTLALFLLGWFFSKFLGRQVAVPLRELRDAVRKVKNEDFYGQIQVITQDEVGELAQEFQSMLEAINERTMQANQSRQILEASPLPVMLANPERKLVYINPAAMQEFQGLTEFLPKAPEEMQGERIDFLLNVSIPHRQLMDPHQLPPTTDVVLGTQTLEITFSPLFDSAQQYVGPVLHWKNVTRERNTENFRQDLVKQLEEEKRARDRMVHELENQNQMLSSQIELDRAQAEIAKATNSLDIGEIAKSALRTLVATTNAQLGILYLQSPEEEESLHLSHYYTIDSAVMDDEMYQVRGLPLHIYNTQEPVIVRNPSKERGSSFHLGAISSYPTIILGYPLIFQSKCLGVLLLSSVANIEGSLLRFIENVSSQLAVAIQNASTFRTVQNQQQYLQATNLELEAATRMKSEFLANMSHELRTPLNAILGFTEAILDTDEDNPLNDYQEDRLNRVFKSARQLLELINSILDLSKIEAGRMDIIVSRFELIDVVQEVLALMESLVSNKPIELMVESTSEIPTCNTDQNKIRQMLINLIGNSIKYTKKGHVKVILSAHEEWIRLAVEDTGVGIPNVELDRIFESFQQVDRFETQKYEGTGLGLALVKSMVRLIGGNISVTSEVEVGTTFTLYFLKSYEQLSTFGKSQT